VSRSRRKTPIFGHTTARSEADDKRLWHKRWRSRVRDQLATLGPDGDPLPVHRQAVSSAWDMAKDGKHWFVIRLAKRLGLDVPDVHRRYVPSPVYLIDASNGW